MYTDKFLDNLPINSIEAAMVLINELHACVGASGIRRSDVEDGYAFFLLFCSENKEIHSSSLPALEYCHNNPADCIERAQSDIHDQYKKHQAVIQDSNARKRWERLQAKRQGILLEYEFTDKEHEDLQSLLNQLRSTIQQHDELTEEHRQRLLRRVEKVQQELHKKVSDIDRFWGLCGESAVVMKKFGKAAGPFLPILSKIVDIVLGKVLEAEGLPAGKLAVFELPDVSQSHEE